MTDEDLLRGRLRSAASARPVGPGSLAVVQARAAQMQRRRNAVRGGMGAFALAAVALVGVASLRYGGPDELGGSVVVAGRQESAEPMSATTEAVAFSIDYSGEAQQAMSDSSEWLADGRTEGIPGAASDDVPDASGQRPAGMTDLPSTVSPSAQARPIAFAAAFRAVVPPGGEGAHVRYSFRGPHVVAQVADAWFAYDGAQWQDTVPSDVPSRESVARGGDGQAAIVLADTTVLDVVTSIEVSAGAAWLKYGDLTWEICPIPDVEVAHGQIGWAGEHLAVIVGVPEQTLYLLERIN